MSGACHLRLSAECSQGGSEAVSGADIRVAAKVAVLHKKPGRSRNLTECITSAGLSKERGAYLQKAAQRQAYMQSFTEISSSVSNTHGTNQAQVFSAICSELTLSNVPAATSAAQGSTSR